VRSSGSCLENREYGRRDPSRWPRGTFYLQKLAITSPTSGGRSVGIVRSRTQTMEFSLVLERRWGEGCTYTENVYQIPALYRARGCCNIVFPCYTSYRYGGIPWSLTWDMRDIPAYNCIYSI
jgi:hypothetical protein